MKRSVIVVGVFSVLIGSCAVSQQRAIPVTDDSMGLSKTSVFDAPSPLEFSYPKTEPSQAVSLARGFEGAPPQIPHRVDTFVPLTAGSNQCLSCHDQPAMIGKKAKGVPTPMPVSHYREVEGKMVRSNANYICTQCHAPQADTKALVENTFGSK
jgi:cytochrome c-type protein NapB